MGREEDDRFEGADGAWWAREGEEREMLSSCSVGSQD
jgi:hypothetical protein